MSRAANATTTLDKPIVIVGAGPAGAALAYLLARRGLPVRLLERHADFSREFRGEGLQPSGLDCLRQMGLEEELAAVPQHRLGRVFFALGDRTVELEGLRGLVGDLRLVSQPGLLAMLTREAAAFPGFRLDLDYPDAGQAERAASNACLLSLSAYRGMALLTIDGDRRCEALLRAAGP